MYMQVYVYVYVYIYRRSSRLSSRYWEHCLVESISWCLLLNANCDLIQPICFGLKRKSDLGNNKICRPLHKDIINNCIFISLRLKFLNSPRGLIGIASEMDVGQKPSA